MKRDSKMLSVARSVIIFILIYLSITWSLFFESAALNLNFKQTNCIMKYIPFIC